MNHNTALQTFLFLTVALAIITPSPLRTVSGDPQERIVGVLEGDWVTYGNITVTWTSNVAEPPPNVVAFNNTEWFSYRVTGIDQTYITFQNITQFKDGNRTNNDAWIDITSGDCSYGAGLAFISAGLEENDTLYEDETVYINETITRTYLGIARETNHWNLTLEQSTSSDPPENIKVSFNYYWDRNTGTLTERQTSFTNQTGEYLTSYIESETIVDTNLWLLDTEPPKADAGNDMTVYQNSVVQFDGTGSNDNVGVVSYEWNFGDGTKASGSTTTHTYTKTGTYNVSLTVKDAAGLTHTDWITVVVKEAPSAGLPPWVPIFVGVALLGTLIFYYQRRTKPKTRKRRLHRVTSRATKLRFKQPKAHVQFYRTVFHKLL